MVIGLAKKVFHKVKELGVKTTIIDLYTLIYDKYYDNKYNLDTYSWVSNADLDVSNTAKEHASMYMATKTSHLRKVLKMLNIPKGKIIIDIGSGKGRVLLVASEFDFREVRGLEFSPKLCLIAKKNIEIYKEQKTTNTVFTIINEDAATYQFKDDEDVFYMFNPFGKVILIKVLDNILESLKRQPRDILIIMHINSQTTRKLIEERFIIKQVREFSIMHGYYIVYDI